MTKFLLVAAALAGSAAAFSPAAVVKQTTGVNAFANDMVGAEGPEPMPFSPSSTSVKFDPAGFAEVSKLVVTCSSGCIVSACTLVDFLYLHFESQR
jgi:hypothetical protein